MNGQMTGRNEGCEAWTTINCPPAWVAQRFGAGNDSSPFGRRPERRCRADTRNCNSARPGCS
jgi:hypothetical protein